MPAPCYTITLLNEAVASSGGASLLETYDSCNATTTIRFKCKCGTEHSKKMRSVIDQGGLTCNPCAKQLMREKVKTTCLEKYGTEHSGLVPEFKAKREATMLAKYGVIHASKSPEIIKKVKASNLAKYGVECCIHAPAIKEKIKATNIDKYGVEYTFQATEVKEKTKTTLFARYGVEYASQMEDHKEKVAETCMKKLGVPHPMMSDDVKAKSTATSLSRYGTKSPKQSESVKAKTKATVLEKYGVDHVMKVPEFVWLVFQLSMCLQGDWLRQPVLTAHASSTIRPESVYPQKVVRNSPMTRYIDHAYPNPLRTTLYSRMHRLVHW